MFIDAYLKSRGFDARPYVYISHSQRSNLVITFIFLHIDIFKIINSILVIILRDRITTINRFCQIDLLQSVFSPTDDYLIYYPCENFPKKNNNKRSV